MNRSLLLLFAMAGSLTGAELEMLPASPVAAFGGGVRTIQVAFRNRADRPLDAEIGREIYQATSATAAAVNKAPMWKKLQLLAHQTVLEEVRVDLPAVRAETRFLVRFTHRDAVLGLQEVWVYPSNLLAQLNTLADGKLVVVCGASESLKEVFAAAGVRLFDPLPGASDLQTNQLLSFGPSGGQFENAPPTSNASIQFIKLPAPDSFIAPAYEVVFTNRAVKVLAQEAMLANLSEDPWTQLRLLRMARLATSHNQFNRMKIKTLNEP